MRGGGWNADSTQVSDGRRASPSKCRDCDNEVRSLRTRLCNDCNARAFTYKQKTARVRANAAIATPTDKLSRSLSGLQGFWLSTVGADRVAA